MWLMKTTYQAELNASGLLIRISPVSTAYTPPFTPSTGNFLWSRVCEFEDEGSVTILAFAISDLDKQGLFLRLGAWE